MEELSDEPSPDSRAAQILAVSKVNHCYSTPKEDSKWKRSPTNHRSDALALRRSSIPAAKYFDAWSLRAAPGCSSPCLAAAAVNSTKPVSPHLWLRHQPRLCASQLSLNSVPARFHLGRNSAPARSQLGPSSLSRRHLRQVNLS